MVATRGEVFARPVTAAVAGAVITACAVLAGAAAAVPGRLSGAGGQLSYEWNYLWVVWPLLLGLAGAGLTLAARSRSGRPAPGAPLPAAQISAAVVAAVLGAQVCGHGVVAVRDWFNTAGASGGMRQDELALVVGFAAVVALCGAVATCVAAGMVWREPAGGWRDLRPRRPGFVVAGVAVVLLLPVAMAFALQAAVVTIAGQFALTFALPWGGGIAAAGWLGGARRRVAAPATAAPATAAPATAAPATAAPATAAPATAAPASKTPVPEAPATAAPASKTPVPEAPATAALATVAVSALLVAAELTIRSPAVVW